MLKSTCLKLTIKDANIVLVDDVASTGKTLLAVAQQLADYSPASISVLVTHALFVDNAISQLKQAHVSNIWSCDSIPHKTNRIFLADFLAKDSKRFYTIKLRLN
ncbi:MAG: phosphoribosyltransferase family protein [Gammaproteobacteria bacterium]|nr:phosphoribosyltransferase family protein [Gammaproteobacteria bacterium]